jgi:hypothetical protein
MMQEELSLHNEEGEVVQSPAYGKEATNSIILHDTAYRKELVV